MPDLAEQLVALVDAAVPPITTDEVRTRARARTRRRSIRTISGALVAVAAAAGFALVATHGVDGRPARVVTRTSAPTTTTAPRPAPGAQIGTLRIDAIGLQTAVYEGTDAATLSRGPGHDPASALPGEPGDVVVYGHRTTYQRPFLRLNELHAGDAISLTTPTGNRFEYSVFNQFVIDENSPRTAVDAPGAALSVVTYAPLGSRLQRLVVSARAVGEISVRIDLPDASVGGGATMTGALVVDNETAAPIRLVTDNGCAEKFAVALGNAEIPASASFTKECGTATTIAVGEQRLPITVRASYPDCATDPSPGLVQCLAGGAIPPLPDGDYQASLVGTPTQLPGPTPVPIHVGATP